jgi:hypothetical protein
VPRGASRRSLTEPALIGPISTLKPRDMSQR